MIKHRLDVVNNIIEVQLNYRLNLNDEIYLWDFLTDDDGIINIEEGSVGIVKSIMITDDCIICDLTYELK